MQTKTSIDPMSYYNWYYLIYEIGVMSQPPNFVLFTLLTHIVWIYSLSHLKSITMLLIASIHKLYVLLYVLSLSERY